MKSNNLKKLQEVIDSLWDEYADEGHLWIKDALKTLLEIKWEEERAAEERNKS